MCEILLEEVCQTPTTGADCLEHCQAGSVNATAIC